MRDPNVLISDGEDYTQKILVPGSFTGPGVWNIESCDISYTFPENIPSYVSNPEINKIAGMLATLPLGEKKYPNLYREDTYIIGTDSGVGSIPDLTLAELKLLGNGFLMDGIVLQFSSPASGGLKYYELTGKSLSAHDVVGDVPYPTYIGNENDFPSSFIFSDLPVAVLYAAETAPYEFEYTTIEHCILTIKNIKYTYRSYPYKEHYQYIPNSYTDVLRKGWHLDLNIKNGQLEMLQRASFTNDQRAALIAYKMNGQVPGAVDDGINWSSYYTEEGSLMQINNQIIQAIQEQVTNNMEKGGSQMYIPVYSQDEKGISLKITKGGQE